MEMESVPRDHCPRRSSEWMNRDRTGAEALAITIQCGYNSLPAFTSPGRKKRPSLTLINHPKSREGIPFSTPGAVRFAVRQARASLESWLAQMIDADGEVDDGSRWFAWTGGVPGRLGWLIIWRLLGQEQARHGINGGQWVSV